MAMNAEVTTKKEVEYLTGTSFHDGLMKITVNRVEEPGHRGAYELLVETRSRGVIWRKNIRGYNAVMSRYEEECELFSKIF